MKDRDILAKVQEVCPNASIGEDLDGQLVVYTNCKVTDSENNLEEMDGEILQYDKCDICGHAHCMFGSERCPYDKIANDLCVGIEEYGTFFYIDTTQEHPILMSAPMDEQGKPDWDMNGEINWSEVTAPESQEMLDRINRIFNTKFKMDEFAGR